MIDLNSSTWATVEAMAADRIASLRDALERDADEVTTTRLRGKLSAYRDVLTWPQQGRDEPTEGIELI